MAEERTPAQTDLCLLVLDTNIIGFCTPVSLPSLSLGLLWREDFLELQGSSPAELGRLHHLSTPALAWICIPVAVSPKRSAKFYKLENINIWRWLGKIASWTYTPYSSLETLNNISGLGILTYLLSGLASRPGWGLLSKRPRTNTPKSLWFKLR